MGKLLQNRWLGSILGALLYFVGLSASWKQYIAKTPSAPVEEEGAVELHVGPSWTFQNPEIELLVSELKKEKEALAVRSAELNELAARLNAEKQELLQTTQRVQVMQSQFDQSLTRIQDEEAANLKKMAKTYASMSPEGASRIFKELDDIVVVKIMRFMKDTETAPILEIMSKQSKEDAKRAATLGEKLRLTLNPPSLSTKAKQ